MLAAAVIATTEFTRADAIVSIVIGLVIVPSAVRLLREAVNVLLQAVPAGIDLDDIRRHVLELDHVHDMHDLHLYTVTSGLPVLSAHVVVDDSCFHDGHAPNCSTHCRNASPDTSTSNTPPSNSNRPYTPPTNTRPTHDKQGSAIRPQALP